MANWHVANTDCINIKREMQDSGLGLATLVYIDPPFGPVHEDTYYGVGNTKAEYLSYMRERIEALASVMKPDGSSFWLHVDQKHSHNLRVIMDDVFGDDAFMNEVAWCYSGPSKAIRWFPRKHDALLWYRLGDKPVFNQPRVPYASGLSVGGKASWAGGDVNVEDYKARGKALEDWWTDIPSLQRNEKEKRGWKTQKPEMLLKRIVAACSNPGDLVVDGFCGSGTTGAVAVKLGRLFLGCDKSEDATAISTMRLSNVDATGMKPMFLAT